MNFKSFIAPKGLIQEDFSILKAQENLDTTKEIQDLLFIQSLEGRSHNGSGMFNKRTYVNTTIDDVVRALELNPNRVKRARQALIDAIVDFVKDTLHGEKRARLVDRKGEPFLGVPLLKDLKVNPRDVLRGIYLGGLRDNADIRKETERIYGVTIGCGECFLVDVRVMARMNLDGEKLAHEAHEDEIALFRKKGLIIADRTHALDERNVRYYYIRHRVGPGQSDDAAIVVAGILYNMDVALGVFLADAVDTLEKYAPEYRDQDQEMAYFIGRGFKELNVSLEDVYEIAYLAAIPPAEEAWIPDSSLRYFLSVDPRTGITALQSHMDFVEGRSIIPLAISYKRTLNTQFYEYIRRRLVNVRRLEAMAVPRLQLRMIDRPLESIVRKNHLVVSKDMPLVEVVKKFRQSKSEVVIVVDKKGEVLGTLTATDLINLWNE